LAQVNIPANLSVRAPLTTPGDGLKGEYWKRPPVSIPLDGATNPDNRIDKLVTTYGTPDGTFQATKLVYTGNDLTVVTNWLAEDAGSFEGTVDNLDDGAFRFTGFVNITEPTTVKIGTTSDDGSRVTIGGVDVVNNDSSHGDATVDTDVVFAAAGVYPIEVTYFNGDWTSDGTGDNLNHSGSTDPALHGGANFHLRVNGADITTNLVALLVSDAGVLVIPPTASAGAPVADAGGSLSGEYWKRPFFTIPLDGATNPDNRIDKVITEYGPPTGTFTASKLVYTGNDLFVITNWLSDDASSFAGTIDNLDDGAFRFRGFLNITNAGTSVSLGTTSDDGSRITIAGIDVVNNDSSHGDATVDTNVVFTAAGLYPIEVTYFNGDWTSDGTGANLNHSGNPDPAVHGGANFHLRVGGADVTAASAGIFLPLDEPPPATAPPPLLSMEFNEGTGTNTIDDISGLVGILGVGMAADPNNVPVIVTNSPSGATDDFALSLNAGSGTTQSALVVNDRIAPILAFPTNAPFTIETWINRDAGSTRQFEGIGAYGRSYKLGLNNGQLQFTLYGIVDINSGLIVPTGEWHHIAAVWTPGTGVEFFFDGTSVTNIAETGVPRAYQNSVLTIGSENIGAAGMANAFQGIIDRFRIHSAALTAEELDADDGSPAAPLPSTVVSYNFNQATHPFPSQGTVARPAVPNAAPVWTADSPSGEEGDSALSFAPGTQVIVADPDTRVQLDSANPDFTMQAWVNFAGNPATRQVFYYNNGPGGALSFSVFTNRTIFVTTLGILDRDSSAAIPDDGNWHHIAVVHENGVEFRFYVDAVLADTRAYTGGVNFTRTNEVFYIGSEPTFGLQYTGMLDRLKVTKGVLTPEQFDFPAVSNPPTVVSAGALGNAIGVVFDMAVDPASATNPANYTIPGANVTGARLIGDNYVLLTVSAVPAGPFAVTVNGVANEFGDAMTAPATVDAVAGSTIPNGLVAHWSFDGHLADSIGGFDGVARGTPAVGFVDGISGFGQALDLTGTNYVEIPGSSNTLQFANSSLSIAGWFRVDTFDKDWQALIAKGENSNYRLARRAATGTIAYAGGVGEGADDVPAVNDGNWHHFVAITDATRAQFGTALYVDGVIHGINTNAAALQAGTANLFIGENPEALNRQFKGELDDIGLWNRVLAPEEIAVLYSGGQGTPVSDLAARPYSIGLNFGADEPAGANQGTLAPLDITGVVPQANWNNLTGPNGTNVNDIVADTAFETAAPTAVEVSWVSNGTWASTGRGEENNQLTGADLTLTLGYLDTGNATTTSVTITNIPGQLTGGGYDVYVYALGGVGGRGGAFRILNAADQAVLKEYVRVISPTNSTAFVEAPIDPASTSGAVGNYMVFTGLTAPAITVQATTADGFGISGTPRAPLNAIQLVASTAAEPSQITIAFAANGDVVITFAGQLQSADSILGPWTDVAGTSPLTVTPTGDAKFYRTKP
jgi:hypothetical protein